MGQVVYLSEVPSAENVTLFDGEPDVMNVPQVARLLGVNPQTVRREIARGRLECVHVGKAVRVTKKQLLEYVGEVSA